MLAMCFTARPSFLHSSFQQTSFSLPFFFFAVLFVHAWSLLRNCNVYIMSESRSITASAAMASTVDTLDGLVLLELFLRYAADAGAVEVCLLGLNAAETAELGRQVSTDY